MERSLRLRFRVRQLRSLSLIWRLYSRNLDLRVEAGVDLGALGGAPPRQGLNSTLWASRSEEAAGEADPKRVEGETACALRRHVEPQEVAQDGVDGGVRHGGESGRGEE